MSQSKVIGIFGDRNVGKSSLINALTGQQVAIVSEVAGTTTDPVRKRIELPGVGVCTLIDTAGLDDDGGALGAERVAKSLAAARQVDLGILVFAGNRFPDGARQVARLLQQLGVPFLLVHNKQDLEPLKAELTEPLPQSPVLDSTASRHVFMRTLSYPIVSTSNLSLTPVWA